MRRFVVVGHEAPTAPDFPLSDLPGAGRLDLLCRCVTTGLLVSHGIREDSRVELVLDDAFAVTFDGADLRGLHPDERSTAALVRTALERRDEAVGAVGVEASPGVTIRRRGLDWTLDAADGQVVALDEDGDPLPDWTPPGVSGSHDEDAGDAGDAGGPDVGDVTFVLSDHRSLTAEERSLVDDRADRRLRLGPRVIHADQAIAVAHHYLDTGGYDRASF